MQRRSQQTVHPTQSSAFLPIPRQCNCAFLMSFRHCQVHTNKHIMHTQRIVPSCWVVQHTHSHHTFCSHFLINHVQVLSCTSWWTDFLSDAHPPMYVPLSAQEDCYKRAPLCTRWSVYEVALSNCFITRYRLSSGNRPTLLQCGK